MGIPTANITPKGEKLLPKRGVYFTVATLDGVSYPALTNVGTCPTVGERALHSETFILDFSGDVYDRNIRISFIEYLREEKSFSDTEELIVQIRKDEEQARMLACKMKWQEIGLN
jgi:riboflavin kinase/FMN adenylyltransferase